MSTLDETGQVYFLQRREGGLIKIGFSKSLSKRIATHSKQRGGEFDLLATIDDVRPSIERDVHEEFDAERIAPEDAPYRCTESFLPTQRLANRIYELGGRVNGHVEDW